MSLHSKRLVFRITVGRASPDDIEQEIDTYLVVAKDLDSACVLAIRECVEEWPNEELHGKLMVTRMSVEKIRILA